ncbi:MAG TPA: amidohydrolase family protein, partial [Homoserinimonas sp.]|nr:amidohydrolase family protein [Homoserinimonas sp.]
PYDIRPADHDVEARRAREQREGKDQVLVSLSSALGIEDLPGAEARDLIAKWHESAVELGDPFLIWAATPLSEFDLDGLRDILTHERIVGLQLPATALGDPQAIIRLKPVLDVLQAADLPLLIHPGPAPIDEEVPAWWPALVPYVAQLHASWLAWHAVGHSQHPRLRVVFAALAGLAPLHHERLVARGGTFGAVDPNIFYEASSYGTRAVDALVRVVGVDPIVHGSDRPYAEPTDPGLGHAFTHALFSANPQALLKGTPR